MTMILSAMPVVYVDPFTDRIASMPLEMLQAYVPYAPHLRLEEAAKVAAIRDEDEAANLLLSIERANLFCTPPEGCTNDEISVEPPTLR